MRTLNFTAGGLTHVVSDDVTLTAGAPDHLSLTTQPSSSAQSGIAFPQQPVVQLRDSANNAVNQAGVSVSATIQTGGGTLSGTTSVNTDSSGSATFTDLAISGLVGDRTLAFDAGGLTGVISDPITLAAGNPANLSINAGDGQTAIAGRAVATPPAVLVTDASGNPVSGVSISFTVASGGGSVSGSPASTDANGIATLGSWTLGTTAGSNTLDASGTNLTTVTFSATGTAGPAASIVIYAGNGGSAVVGGIRTIQVRVTDANSNPVSGESIDWAAATGGGSVSAPSSLTDASGIARIDWTFGTTPGTQTATASDANLGGSPVTFSVDTVPGPAAGADSTLSANPLAVPPDGTSTLTIQLKDQYGNDLTSGGDTVLLNLDSGSGSLSSVTDNGNGTYTATYTAPSLGSTGTAVISGTVNAAALGNTVSIQYGAGPPTTIAIFSGDGTSATVGTQVTLAAKVTDANNIPVAGRTVSWTVATGGGSLSTPTSVTDANGIARSDWTLGTTSGDQTVTASAVDDSSNPLTNSPLTFTVTATPGPAAVATSTIDASPTSITANGTDTSTITVQLKDQYGNLLTGTGGTVALSTTAGSLSSVTDNTDGTYTATLTAPTTVGSASITGTLNSVAITDTAAVSLVAGPLDHFLVEAAGGGAIGTQAVNVPFSIQITAQDAFNNTVTTFVSTVTLSTTPSGGLSAGSPTAAFTAGVLAAQSVTFGTGGLYTLTATGGGKSGTSTSFAVNAPPAALSDGPSSNSTPGTAFHTAFNTTLTTGTAPNAATPSLLANDTLGYPTAAIASFGGGDLGGTVTDHAAGTTVTVGTDGALTVNADGSLTFVPPTGFTGTLTFDYRLSNTGGFSDATVTLAVGTRPSASIDTFAPSGTILGNVSFDTASSSHFSVLTNDAGDALVLQSSLSGQTGGTFTLNTTTGTFAYQPAAGFSGAAGFTYTVGNGFGTVTATVSFSVSTTRIWFVNSAAGSNGTGTQASPFTCLTGTGCASAVLAPNDTAFLATGSYTGGLTLPGSLKLVGQGASASLATIMGVTPIADSTLPSTGGTPPSITTSAASTNGLTLGSGDTLRGFSIGNTTGSGISGSSFGTLTVGGDVAINDASQALNLTTGTLSGSFSAITSSAGTNNLFLSGVGSSGTFDFGSGALSGATSDGLKIDGGSGSFSYSGTVSNTATLAVNVTNKSGGTVTFSGALNPMTAAKGISVTSNSGGTAVTFSGAAIQISTGTGTGVNLTSNTGASVSFSGGGLAITTTTGTGFNAANGGTVTVTGSGNTSSSAGGLALSVSSATIGAGGLVFRSLSANGGTNGILLSSTGASGGLTVTGDGSTAGSGGTIQSTTGHGISLTSTKSPSFAYMKITNIALSGIWGTQVTNFSLDHSVIDGVNTSHDSTDSDVAFDLNGGGSTENNVSGNVSITNSTINNSYQFGIDIYNFAGTISNLTITGNSFTSSTAHSLSQGSAISVYANRSASNSATITSGSISSNTIRNFPSGAGIQVLGGNTADGQSVSIASLASPLLIEDNDIAGAGTQQPTGGDLPSPLLGTNGIAVTAGQSTNAYFTIGASGHPNTITNVGGDGVACSLFGTGTEKCTIAFNNIDAHNFAGSPGINTGADSATSNTNQGTLYLDIHDNMVKDTSGNGILSTVRSVDSTGIFHIENNTVLTPLGSLEYGIRVDSGNGSEGASGATVCLKIDGNTTAGSKNASATLQAPGIGLRQNHASGPVSTFNIDGLTPSPANDTQMATYVSSHNSSASGTGFTEVNGVASISSGATFGAATCTIP